jgi:Flp pilus assembly protein TadD
MIRYRTELVLALLLATSVFLAFGPALGYGFIRLDDNLYVGRNASVLAGLGRRGLVWAFTTVHASNWHPLTWLSLQADASIMGQNPGAFHLTNLVLHAANGVLLFLALRLLTGAVRRSALAAALFAVHPLRVESVAWVAERKDVLSGFFWMLTLLAYGWYARRPSAGRYLAAFLAFAAGLLSKPMVVTLPFVLLLLDYWPLRRVGGADAGENSGGTSVRSDRGAEPASRSGRWLPLVLEKVPLLILTVASCVMTVLAQQKWVATLEKIPFGLRLGNAVVSYVAYLGKTVWPADLAPMYPFPTGGLPAWQPACSGVVLAAVTVLVLRARSSRPYLLVGWLWYLGTLVPVIGLAQVGRQAMADRYTYLPSVGLCLMAVWGVADLVSTLQLRPVAVGAAVGLLTVLLALTHGQVQYWSSDKRLWQHTLDATGADNAFAHISLAMALANRGEVKEASRHFDEALRRKPSDPEMYSAAGLFLIGQGQLNYGIGYLRAALSLSPNDAELQNNLGTTLFRSGLVAEAIEHYRAAAAGAPDSPAAFYNLGVALERQGAGGDEAVEAFRQALRIDPGSVYHHTGLALALSRRGRKEAATVEYREALRLDQHWPEEFDRSAWAMATHPELPRKGWLAVPLAEQLCDATGHREPRFLDTLAAAYAEVGDFDRALEAARQALNLASRNGQTELARSLHRRIQCFEAHQPWRDTAGLGHRR